MKTLIAADKYKMFIEMFSAYQKSSNYESFLRVLYTIFIDAKFNYILRGTFVKCE